MKKTALKRGKGLRKASPRKKIDKELTYLWGLVVRERDKHLCQWCLHDGKHTPANQPHHIVPKSLSKTLKWTVINGVTLCFYCHHRRLLNEPVEFADFIKKHLLKHGSSYEILMELKKDMRKFTAEEKRDAMRLLEILLKTYQKGEK